MNKLIINLRGTNGSGKTTLARAWRDPQGGSLALAWYDAPTKRDPGRRLRTEGYAHDAYTGPTTPPHRIGLVGSYATACGGMDTIPGFAAAQDSIRHLLGRVGCDTVVAEGVLAATVWGSWAQFDREAEAAGVAFAWTYLDVPLGECLRRIRLRQEAAGRVRDIKEDLVANKVRAIRATRTKALAEGRLVYDLPYGGEAEALAAIVERRGEVYRAA